MGKFCSNCGKELNDNQDVCLGCGKVISRSNVKPQNTNYVGYKISTGVVMIVLGFCLVCASESIIYANPVLVYTLPGICGIVSGILSLCSKNNSVLLLPSGIVLMAGALFNFIGIIDISIFSILAITFGILNIVYSRK